MKKLILILPLILSGCLYINRDVGLTTYQYDKCEEYYDADGVYHKDCHDTVFEKAGNFTKDSFIMIRESVESFFKGTDKKATKNNLNGREVVQRRVKKKCICSKSCIKKCQLSRHECLKKCCHEKK